MAWDGGGSTKRALSQQGAHPRDKSASDMLFTQFCLKLVGWPSTQRHNTKTDDLGWIPRNSMVEGEPIPPSSPLIYTAFTYTKQKGKCIKKKFSLTPSCTQSTYTPNTSMWVGILYLYVFVCIHIHVKLISKWTQASQPLLLLYEGLAFFLSRTAAGP